MFKLLAVAMLFVAVALGDTLSDRGAMEYPVLPVRNVRGIHGIPSNIRYVPWQVAVLYQFTVENSIANVFQCSGSIISEYWVLTAAHCLFYREGTEKPVNVVMAGATVYLDGSSHDINSKIHHPAWQYPFDNKVSWNDIGLISVEQPFRYYENLRPINLYNRSMCTLEGSNGAAGAWGSNGDTINPPNQVQSIFLDILPRSGCDWYLSHYSNIDLAPSQMCARGMYLTPNVKNSLCNSDSSAPVVVNDTLVGIIGWTVDICGGTEGLSVFHEVASYRPWIFRQVHLHFENLERTNRA